MITRAAIEIFAGGVMELPTEAQFDEWSTLALDFLFLSVVVYFLLRKKVAVFIADAKSHEAQRRQRVSEGHRLQVTTGEQLGHVKATPISVYPSPIRQSRSSAPQPDLRSADDALAHKRPDGYVHTCGCYICTVERDGSSYADMFTPTCPDCKRVICGRSRSHKIPCTTARVQSPSTGTLHP